MKLFAAALTMWLLAGSALWGQNNGVSVELTLEQDQFLPDEDLMVGVRIMNRSGQIVQFGTEADWVTFTIQGDKNLVVAKLGEAPVAGEFSLRSAQVGMPRFNLTPYFDFRRQGHYRVTATVKIPQWNQEITSKPKAFAVMNGVPLPNFPELEFGVPPPGGESNAVPEVRKYILQKATYVKQLKLYFRLTDASGSKTLRVYPIGPMVSFGQPEAQIDRFSNFHVIHQVGAKAFSYCVINPDGQLLARQTHDYTATRPTLRADSEGRVFVAGGMRRVTANDLPAPLIPALDKDAKTFTP
jgi:hypothetical protein